MTAYESQQVGIKDELSKVNKKKKQFDEKVAKTRTDIERRVAEEETINERKK